MIEKIKSAILQNASVTEDIIHFEETPNYTGTIHLQALYKAILTKQVLNMTYTPFREKTEQYVFHPQLLKQYNRRWFLIGFRGNIIEDYKQLRALPLDRIDKFEKNEEISHQYVPRETIIKLTESTVGVVPPWGEKAIVEEVIFKIDKSRAYYLVTKPLHASQIIVEQDDKSITFALWVIVSRELVTNLLQYGKEFTVIKPESLRKELKEILEAALEKHK
jgi:predicted DNA-binding transcriptional regulator YafY